MALSSRVEGHDLVGIRMRDNIRLWRRSPVRHFPRRNRTSLGQLLQPGLLNHRWPPQRHPRFFCSHTLGGRKWRSGDGGDGRKRGRGEMAVAAAGGRRRPSGGRLTRVTGIVGPVPDSGSRRRTAACELGRGPRTAGQAKGKRPNKAPSCRVFFHFHIFQNRFLQEIYFRFHNLRGLHAGQ
jgi:hypothetical protein